MVQTIRYKRMLKFDLATLEECKAELTQLAGYIWKWW